MEEIRYYIRNMTRRQETGRVGEDAAVEYLKNKRYRIMDRNYWKPWGELDIIARAPDTTLVLVEVKTIYKVGGFINPEDNMTRAKLIKTKRAAEIYANAHEKLITDRGWRIDLIAVSINQDGVCDIKQYENI